MSTETWLSLAKYILYVGVVMATIGTIGVPYFSSKINKVKDETLGRLFLQSETYQADLEAQQSEIENLKTEALQSRQGVVQQWDFNGARREGRAGTMTLTIGVEMEVFRELQRLEAEGQHAAIIQLASHQIEETPSWLTPYLARGVAYSNLGRVDEAIKDLEHVVRGSAGDQAYSQAAVVLEQLRSAEK